MMRIEIDIDDENGFYDSSIKIMLLIWIGHQDGSSTRPNITLTFGTNGFKCYNQKISIKNKNYQSCSTAKSTLPYCVKPST